MEIIVLTLYMINPKISPLEPILNQQKKIKEGLLRPFHYETTEIHNVTSRNVDLEHSKSFGFSESMDDFSEKYISEDKRKYKNIVLSPDRYHSSGGDLDSMLINIKADIKKTNDKLHKIRKQQIVHMNYTVDYFDKEDTELFKKINVMLTTFDKIKL